MIFVPPPPAIGNAHLVLLHFPVGLLGAALLLAWWTRRDARAGVLVTRLLAANAVAAALTAAAGFALAARGDYAEAALGRHRWAGVACAALAAAAWWLRARRGAAAARIGLVALTSATMVAGHYGAALTHGEGLFAWPAARPAPGTTAASGEIHPLLARHCVECHGPKKQKGRLRLDTLEAAKRGGRSGEPALVPGDAEAGEAMARLRLPPDDEEAMPPSPRKPLSEAEKAELARWIAGLGAS